MLRIVLLCGLLWLLLAASSSDTGSGGELRSSRPLACDSSSAFENDADSALDDVLSHYAYLGDKDVDWDRARRSLRDAAGHAATKAEFVTVLEQLLDDLYDPHATLKVNTRHSPRLVPAGLDVWAEWRGATAVITEVRPGFSADQAGLRPGMIIVSIDGTQVRDAARARIGDAVRLPNRAAMSWGLLSALAGRHDRPRLLRVRDPGGSRDVQLDRPGQHRVDDAPPQAPVDTQTIALTDQSRKQLRAGYIRLNALGDTATVSAFDSALSHFRNASGLLLDLRNTPNGGNTDVAEPILGRLITHASVYQRVVPRTGKSSARTVEPRGPWQFTAPIVVLVDHWTGSMGEGMAIGLDGMRRAIVIGTRMAGLAGAVDDFVLPCTGITLALPTARLLHVDGTPRERWVPPVLVDPAAADWRSTRDPDPIRSRGLSVLIRSIRSRALPP